MRPISLHLLALATAAALAGTAVLAGCTKPIEQATPHTTPAPRVSPAGTPSRTAAPTGTRTTTPQGTPSFVEQTALPCSGHPSAEQIIALVRRTSGNLPANAAVTVKTGPLCAGTWQYTVLSVPDRDALQVVSKGTPESLQLVTAGTDVCTVPVRATAPAGLRAIIRC